MSPSLLRVFQHPALFASIAVLLLNDHLFKNVQPSWLTGKLSDFAGLFFFPFLLAVMIAAVCGKHLAAKYAVTAGMGITAVIFAAIKTIPVANTLATHLYSVLFHQPTTIALDPTDLIALAVLLPTYLLWRNIESERTTRQPQKLHI